MKKLSAVMCAVLLMLGMAVNVEAQKTWDFATLDANDAELMDGDANWYHSTETKKNRYSYTKALTKEAVKAGGQEVAYTEGLLLTVSGVTSGEGNLRAGNDASNKRMWLADGSVITIPGLKAGMKVTVYCMSSSKTEARGINAENITATAGDFNTTKPGTAQSTNVGTVTADGDVTLTMNGAMYVYLIKTEDPGDDSEGGGDTEGGVSCIVNDYSASVNTQANQAVLTLKDGALRYYNTADVSSIDVADDGKTVTVNQQVGTYTFNGQVTGIAFRKADKGGEEQGQVVNVDGKVQITEARGWLESAYVKFQKFADAAGYNVYYKGGGTTEYKKIDAQLVRDYGSYVRADVVGLKAAEDYAIKVVPVTAEGNETTGYNEATGLLVKSYSREGFAFMGYQPGAYNADGTLKSGAKVLYVTKKSAKSITTTVNGVGSVEGIQAIIDAYQKGKDTTPIAFRFVGLVEKDDLDGISSSEEGIQIKGKNADAEMPITIEGIGDDATVRGFGFLVRNAKGVEFRNIGIMRCMDDGISMDTNNSNIWVHHVDFFYGPNGGGDHAKGDGACDVKTNSKYVTVSYNRYWDTGKTNMFGMKSESGPNYISYDHNWFDHSDSRHPRVRTMSVHVWNNFFDNVAKYGVGATTGASVFVENNYFLKTKKPILTSMQGTDAKGSGTFSGEDGGMIKAYGNYVDKAVSNFSYYTQAKPAATGYDAYETSSRDAQVPATEKARQGGSAYNNFDTNSGLMYTYSAVAAEDVPALVTGYYGAGRMNHGDFRYSFADNVGNDNTDSAYDATLGGMLDSYKTSLVSVYGDAEGGSGDNSGGDSGQGGGTGGDSGQGGGTGGDSGQGGGQTPAPEGTIIGSFDGAPSNAMFNVGSSEYGDGKSTYEGTYYKKGVKLNSNGSITFTPQKNYNMTIVLATAKAGTDVKLNGTKTTVSGTTNAEGAYYELQPIVVTAGTEYVITKGTAESLVMVIKLVPAE